MYRHTALSLVLLTVLNGGVLQAGFVSLTFDSATPGTLLDKNGIGTGFTHRLPGTGAGIASFDPNMTLDTANSRLVLKSTRSDFNTTTWGRNLSGMEAPSLLIQNLGSQDFLMEACFANVLVNQASDQIGIFAGASADLVIRGGVHEQFQSSTYQGFMVTSKNGSDQGPAGGQLSLFHSGDDALFRMGRIAGQWFFYWENLTTGSHYQTASFSDASLDAINDMYFGVFNHDARNATGQDAYLKSFSIRTGDDVHAVPEPSSLAIFGVLSIIGMGKVRKRRSL